MSAPDGRLLWLGASAAGTALAPPAPEAAMVLWILAVLLLGIGLVATVVPRLVPGAPLVLLGLFAAAATDGFERVGWITLSVIGLLAGVALLLEAWATFHGARLSGASRLATVGAAVGTIVGLFFALPGLLVGPFLGAFAGELIARRGWRQAGRAGLGAWWGLLLATALRSAVVMLMIGTFALAYLFG